MTGKTNIARGALAAGRRAAEQDAETTRLTAEQDAASAWYAIHVRRGKPTGTAAVR